MAGGSVGLQLMPFERTDRPRLIEASSERLTKQLAKIGPERVGFMPDSASEWRVYNNVDDKEGLMRFICAMLFFFASAPLFFVVQMAHAIMYGQYREDACPQLNHMSLYHVATWIPFCVAFCISAFCLGATFEEDYNWLARFCEPFEYSYYYVQLPLLTTVGGLVALAAYGAIGLKGLTDPDFCAGSGLFKVSIASVFSELWLATALLIAMTLYLTYDRKKRVRADYIPNSLEEAFSHERKLQPPVTVLITGAAGAGQIQFLLQIIRLAASKRLPHIHLTSKTLSPGQKSAYKTRWTSLLRQNPNLIRMSDDKRVTWDEIDKNPNAYARAAAVSIGAAGDEKHELKAVSIAMPSVRVGEVRIDVKPAATIWRLGVDPMTIVFRMAGPAATARVASSVCRVWRQYANWQRLVPLWWLDATGERMHHINPVSASVSALPAAGLTPLATDGSPASRYAVDKPAPAPAAASAAASAEGVMDPSQIMRVLSMFDNRKRGVHDIASWVECGSRHVAPLRFIAWNDQTTSRNARMAHPSWAELQITVINLLHLLDGLTTALEDMHRYRLEDADRNARVVWWTNQSEFVRRLDDMSAPAADRAGWCQRLTENVGKAAADAFDEKSATPTTRLSERILKLVRDACMAEQRQPYAFIDVWACDGSIAASGKANSTPAMPLIDIVPAHSRVWGGARLPNQPPGDRYPYFALAGLAAPNVCFESRACAIARYSELIAIERGGGQELRDRYPNY